jgi:rhodanese-related sulfurtransferase
LIVAFARVNETRSQAAASTIGAFGERPLMVEQLEPAELKSQLLSGELWQVVDVREPWEIEIASVSGTINIPMAGIADRLHELDSSKATAVLCHSGARSQRVALFLADKGFTRVANIRGGIDRWSQTADPAVARY